MPIPRQKSPEELEQDRIDTAAKQRVGAAVAKTLAAPAQVGVISPPSAPAAVPPTMRDRIKSASGVIANVAGGFTPPLARAVNNMVPDSMRGSPVAKAVGAYTFPARAIVPAVSAGLEAAGNAGLAAGRWAVTPPAVAPAPAAPGQAQPRPAVDANGNPPSTFVSPPAPRPSPAGVMKASAIPPERIVGPNDVADTLRDARAYNASVAAPAPAAPKPAPGTPQERPPQGGVLATRYGTIRINPGVVVDPGAVRQEMQGAVDRADLLDRAGKKDAAAKMRGSVSQGAGLVQDAERVAGGERETQRRFAEQDGPVTPLGPARIGVLAAAPTPPPARPRTSAEFNAARENGTAFRTGISGADRRAQDERLGIPRGLNTAQRRQYMIANGLINAKGEVLRSVERIRATAEENKARTAGEYGVLGRRETANGVRAAAQTRADAAVTGKYIDAASRKDVATIRAEADKEISTWDNATRERVAGMAVDGRLEEARIAAGTKDKTYSDVFTATMKGLDQLSFATQQERAAEADRITKYLINQNAKSQSAARQPAAGGAPGGQDAKRTQVLAGADRILANPNSTQEQIAKAKEARAYYGVN